MALDNVGRFLSEFTRDWPRWLRIAVGLARHLARLMGESMTEAVTRALRERLARERARREAEATFAVPTDRPFQQTAVRLRHAAGCP